MEISLIITGAIVGVSFYVGLSGFRKDLAAMVYAALKCWNKHEKEGEGINLDKFLEEFSKARSRFRLF